MNNKNFERCVKDQLDYCKNLLVFKGIEYSKDIDRLSAFKRAAALQNVTIKEALAGMMAKHTISIYDMIYTKEKYNIDKWEEKITDHINYLLLLKAVILEENEELNNGKI